MRILQITTELHPAGAERVVTNLSVALKNLGHDLLVVSLRPLPEKSIIVDELNNASIPIKTLNITKTTWWRMFELKHIIAKYQPDIVHSHLIHANLAVRLNIRQNRNFKVVSSVHIAERRKSCFWHFLLDRLTYNRCDIQTAVSRAVRDFHSKKIGIPPEKVPVIYNGIHPPTPLNDEQKKILKKEWELDDCDIVIGSVGRLNWQKGYDILFNSLSKLSQSIPQGEKWGIMIIGEGPERSRLEAQLRKTYDNLRVYLPGYRSDAAQCMGAFDLFVMPSRYEGFGLTLIEAMSHGIPIIANPVDSLPELLADYQNGKLVDFTNSQLVTPAILRAIKKAAISPPFKFTIDNMVSEYLKLYESQYTLLHEEKN